MASAMTGSGPWKPNATRVSSRILVLVDSMSALDRPHSRVASIAARLAVMRCASSMNAGSRDRRAQPSHWSRACFAFVAFDGEHVSQRFFEQVGAPQPGVGLGDPVELVALFVGEVVVVLPQREAGSADLFGVAAAGDAVAVGAGPCAGRRLRSRRGDVRHRATSMAQCTTWNGVGAADRVRGAFGNDAGDPVRHVG